MPQSSGGQTATAKKVKEPGETEEAMNSSEEETQRPKRKRPKKVPLKVCFVQSYMIVATLLCLQPAFLKGEDRQAQEQIHR